MWCHVQLSRAPHSMGARCMPPSPRRSGTARRRAVIGAFGQPFVFERDLPQMLLDRSRRGFSGQLSDPRRVAAVVFGREWRCDIRVVHCCSCRDRSIAFPLEPLAEHLAVAPDRFGLLADTAFRWLFVSPAPLHVAEGALALHFFL